MPLCFVIALSLIAPPYKSATKVIAPLGDISIRTFTVLHFLKLEKVTYCFGLVVAMGLIWQGLLAQL